MLSHLTTAKPLTKVVTGAGFFSTGACSMLDPSPLGCASFFRLSSSIFFLNISMKLPSLANMLAPELEAALTPGGGLEQGDAGLPQLDSLLLLPLLTYLSCERLESMFSEGSVHKQTQSSFGNRKKKKIRPCFFFNKKDFKPHADVPGCTRQTTQSPRNYKYTANISEDSVVFRKNAIKKIR